MEKRFLNSRHSPFAASLLALALSLSLASAQAQVNDPVAQLPKSPAFVPVSDLTPIPVTVSPAAPASGSNPIGSNTAAPLPQASQANKVSAANLQVAIDSLPDLWTRIRKGFAMPDLEGDLVRDREQWYATRPDYISRMTERSSKYLYHIVEEIERRKMPTELALLPFIESAFNPQAMSTAKAAGMWQFIPSTGKNFQLKQNTFRDERRDVLASTRAALDYLQKLYGMFGDWHLALAAYNWGEGSVARAIKRNQSKGLGTGYTDLNMPNETRYYVPKLQAVKNIVAHPQNFNAPLPSIADHPYFQSVAIKRDIDVSLAARLSEVNLDDFRALNPSANKPVLLAAGTPQILLPWDNASIFENNLQGYDKQLATWTAWHAPRNMKPADAAKAVGMSEAQLREINHIPARMLVKAGSVLLVPRSAKQADKDVSVHVAENGQTLLMPEPQPPRKVMVKAKAGESVTSMAKRLRVNAAQFAKWNQLSATDHLQAGQALVIFVQAKAGGKKSVRKTKPAPARPHKK